MNQYKIIKISQKTNGRCFYCNSSEAFEIDHFTCRKEYDEYIEDIKRLGLFEESRKDIYDLENLFLCCSKCNKKKGNKYAGDFMGGYTIAWSRYYRSNRRIGLLKEAKKEWYI